MLNHFNVEKTMQLLVNIGIYFFQKFKKNEKKTS